MKTLLSAAFLIGFLLADGMAAELRTDWIDPDTGHRLIRLSTEAGSSTLYFHDNSYSPEGDRMVFNSPSGIMVIEIARLGSEPPKPELAVPDGRGTYAAHKKREVYFVRGGRGRGGPPGGQKAPGAATAPKADAKKGDAKDGRGKGGGGAPPPEVFAYHYDTKQTRRVPHATRTLINIDETLALTTVPAVDPTGKVQPPPPRELRPQMERMFPGKKREELTPDQIFAAEKEDGLARRLLNQRSEAFVFTNLKTGESRTLGYQYAWLNHMQFSPTDPNLLLYCHEGTWHEIDRIWTIRTDGSGQQLRHKRTMDMEIAGHEFWSHDGRTIWFDQQTPRSEQFWLSGLEIATGKLTRYHIERDWWSVHYNISRDGKLFSGDGGDPTQVAFAKDGMWMNLFRPQADGTLQREKLVNMAKHNYVSARGGIEPNGSITPDGKWVVFSGNFDGARHVYAVEIARAP